jgi:hypothetical protein
LNLTNITTSTSLATTSISTGILSATNISSATATLTTATIANLRATNITTGTLRIDTGITSVFNSNTIGNLYTTGGNVGINTTAPAYRLDVSGTIRSTGAIIVDTSRSANFQNQAITSNNNWGMIFCSDRPTTGNLGLREL